MTNYISFSIRDSLLFEFTSTAVIFFSYSIIHKQLQSFDLFSYSGTPFITDQRLGLHCLNTTPYILFVFYLIFSSISMYIISANSSFFSSGWTFLPLHLNIMACFTLQIFSLDPPYLLPHTTHLSHYQIFSPPKPLVYL